MSLFGAIMDKIFHHPAAKAVEQAAVQAATQLGGQPAATASQAAPAAQPQPAPAATPQAAPPQAVDVEAVLSQMAAQKGGGGNWRTSIVDLLKLLDLDSSLQARKQLAQELNVHAGADGSAEENIALHRAVMAKLAENGGKVPQSMKA
jgi:hypothetical protein